MKKDISSITRLLFRLSDAVAWILLFFAIAWGLGAQLIDVVPPAKIGLGDRWLVTDLCAIVALGAFLLTRRRAIGLPLVLLLPLAFNGNAAQTIFYLLGALVVFGVPLVAVLLTASHRNIDYAS